MSMFTPIGVGGRRIDRRRRRRRWPAITMVVLVVLASGAAASWWFVIREPASGAVAAPRRCPAAKPTPATLLKPGQVNVNVYNSTNRFGLAASVSEKLDARGYKIVKVDNDPLQRSISGVAEIRHGEQGIGAARTILAVAPGAELVADARKTTRVDLVLGKRYDALAAKPEPPMVTPAPRPGC